MIIVRHPGRACLGPPQEPGLADVRLYMDGRERTAEGDEVVEAVDLVRRRVVLPTGAEEPVLDANFLVLLSGPAQFLIDIADGYERAVDCVIHFLPVQRDCAEGLIVVWAAIVMY